MYVYIDTHLPARASRVGPAGGCRGRSLTGTDPAWRTAFGTPPGSSRWGSSRPGFFLWLGFSSIESCCAHSCLLAVVVVRPQKHDQPIIHHPSTIRTFNTASSATSSDCSIRDGGLLPAPPPSLPLLARAGPAAAMMANADRPSASACACCKRRHDVCRERQGKEMQRLQAQASSRPHYLSIGLCVGVCCVDR